MQFPEDSLWPIEVRPYDKANRPMVSYAVFAANAVTGFSAPIFCDLWRKSGRFTAWLNEELATATTLFAAEEQEVVRRWPDLVDECMPDLAFLLSIDAKCCSAMFCGQDEVYGSEGAGEAGEPVPTCDVQRLGVCGGAATPLGRHGLFIVLEGIDGSGKSTQARRLAGRIGAALEAEPTDGPHGRAIRHYLSNGSSTISTWGLTKLFFADREQHCRDLEHLLQRCDVVCDRYQLSTLCYQGALLSQEASPGLMDDATLIGALNAAAGGGILAPHLTIVIRLPIEQAKARRAARGKPADRLERDDLLVCVDNLYLIADELVPSHNVKFVDASGTEDQVEQAIWSLVEPLLLAGCCASG
jgi:dTMP kinase